MLRLILRVLQRLQRPRWAQVFLDRWARFTKDPRAYRELAAVSLALGDQGAVVRACEAIGRARPARRRRLWNLALFKLQGDTPAAAAPLFARHRALRTGILAGDARLPGLADGPRAGGARRAVCCDAGGCPRRYRHIGRSSTANVSTARGRLTTGRSNAAFVRGPGFTQTDRWMIVALADPAAHGGGGSCRAPGRRRQLFPLVIAQPAQARACSRSRPGADACRCSSTRTCGATSSSTSRARHRRGPSC